MGRQGLSRERARLALRGEHLGRGSGRPALEAGHARHCAEIKLQAPHAIDATLSPHRLGTATLSVPLGVFGHGSRKNPTNAKLLTISARRFKRVDVTAVRDRWLPTAVAFRRLWEITTGRTSLYVWTRVEINFAAILELGEIIG